MTKKAKPRVDSNNKMSKGTKKKRREKKIKSEEEEWNYINNQTIEERFHFEWELWKDSYEYDNEVKRTWFLFSM